MANLQLVPDPDAQKISLWTQAMTTSTRADPQSFLQPYKQTTNDETQHGYRNTLLKREVLDVQLM